MVVVVGGRKQRRLTTKVELSRPQEAGQTPDNSPPNDSSSPFHTARTHFAATSELALLPAVLLSFCSCPDVVNVGRIRP